MPAIRKATKSAPKKRVARKAASRKPASRGRSAPAAGRTRSSAVPKAAVPVAALAKAPKLKKPKLVRDSFTIPKAEYEQIESLKKRAAKTGRHAKKSELLRAGLMALSAMEEAGFLAVLAKVPALKTGRPARA